MKTLAKDLVRKGWMSNHVFLCFSIFVAILCGAGVGLLTYQHIHSVYLAAKVAEADTLIALTNSYFSTYSVIHKANPKDGYPVPAQFRAQVASKFNNEYVGSERFIVKMVGMPGREITTPPLDAEMASNLELMSTSRSFDKYSRITNATGKPLLRSVYPSTATDQSCSSCHNAIQESKYHWKVGDLMGAHVVERGIHAALVQNRVLGIIAGLAAAALVLLALRSKHQNDQLKDKSKELLSLANTDSLTGCLNRRALDSRVTTLFDSSTGNDALIALDIDHFKKINDQYGHPAGDRVLELFADIVRQHIRAADLFARVGGEEFLIYLPAATNDVAREIAQRIVRATETHEFSIGGRNIEVTVSAGVVKMIKNKKFQFHHYNKVADTFLYRAKQSGRNCVFHSG